jgi:hypothetical protein
VRILGPNVGLTLGVMASNVAAVIVAAWAARRAGGDRALVVVTLLSAGLAWSMGSELLFDVWQPHAMVLASWALLVVLWALGTGDPIMLPVAAGLASLVVQTHLSFVYLTVAVGLASVICAWWSWRRTDPHARRSWRRPLIATAIVTALAWLLPIVDQVRGNGNLGALLTSGRSTGDPIGARLGVRLVASVVSLPPWWARPGFADTIQSVPVTDGHVRAVGLVGTGAAVAGVGLTVIALAGVVVLGLRRRRQDVTVIGILALVALAACLLSMLVSPLNVVGLTPHQMRWLWPVSALVLTAVLVAMTTFDRLARPLVAAVATATVLIAVLTVPTYVVPAGPTVDRDAIPTIGALVDQLDRYHPDGPVLFDDLGRRAFEPVSGPVFAALGRNGVDVRVSSASEARQVGDGRRADGTERRQLVLRLGQAALETPPGARRVAFVDGLDPEAGTELDALRPEVIAAATRSGVALNDAGLAAVRRGDINFGQPLTPPGADATDLERSGWIRVLAMNGWLQAEPGQEQMYRRYAELAARRERLAAALFEEPVTGA